MEETRLSLEGGVLPGAHAMSRVVAALTPSRALTQVNSRVLRGGIRRSEFLPQLLFIMHELAERMPCMGSMTCEEYDQRDACEQ